MSILVLKTGMLSGSVASVCGAPSYRTCQGIVRVVDRGNDRVCPAQLPQRLRLKVWKRGI